MCVCESRSTVTRYTPASRLSGRWTEQAVGSEGEMRRRRAIRMKQKGSQRERKKHNVIQETGKQEIFIQEH